MVSGQSKARKAVQLDSNSPERAQFRATLDENSIVGLSSLCRVLQLKQSPLLGELIKTVGQNRGIASQVVDFYREEWPAIMPRKINQGKLFNWPVEVDDTLKRLSWEVIGTGNKSETLRVLIAFFAKQNNVTVTRQ